MLPRIAGEDETADVLEKVGHEGVRKIGLNALRVYNKSYPTVRRLSLHGDIGLRFFELLAQEHKNLPINPVQSKELFLDCTERGPRFRFLAEFIWWLVRAGYVVPSTLNPLGMPTILFLTDAGMRLAQSTDEDHPMLPGFLNRFKARVPSLIDEVIAHIEDARSCLDNNLNRPAMVLIGLAYETAIEHLANRLISVSKLTQSAWQGARNADQRLKLIRQELPNFSLTKYDADQVERALDCADRIRKRRNDASHTHAAFGFDVKEEIDEYLVAACHHLPFLWILDSVV